MACRAAHSAERRMRSTLRLCRRTVGKQLSSGSGRRVLAWTSAPPLPSLPPPPTHVWGRASVVSFGMSQRARKAEREQLFYQRLEAHFKPDNCVKLWGSGGHSLVFADLLGPSSSCASNSLATNTNPPLPQKNSPSFHSVRLSPPAITMDVTWLFRCRVMLSDCGVP